MLDWKPKEEFRGSPHAKPWSEVTDTTMFKSAISSAFLHYMTNLPRSVDASGSAANDYRRQGATAVLMILLNLSQQDPPPQQRDVSLQNLDHKI